MYRVIVEDNIKELLKKVCEVLEKYPVKEFKWLEIGVYLRNKDSNGIEVRRVL